MATQTANLGLTLPIGSEKVKRQVINSNNEIIDAAVGKIEDGIAYRLGETNTTGSTLAVGTYVYVSGNSTLAEGLYTVSTAIGTGITLSSSNCTAVSGGGLNALNSNISLLSDQIATKLDNKNGTHTISVLSDTSFVTLEFRNTSVSGMLTRLNIFDTGKVTISRYANGAWQTETTLRNAD